MLLCSPVFAQYLVDTAAPTGSADAPRVSSYRTVNPPEEAAVTPLTGLIAPLTEVELLAKIRETNGLTYTNLKSVVCKEEILRYKGSISGEAARGIDTITANLSFEGGNERYTEVRQNSHKRRSISSLSGAWSEGELGTLLSQTLTLLKTQKVTFLRYEELDGRKTALYEFDVEAGDSPWNLVVESQNYKIGFRTALWASTDTGDLLKIARTSISIPEGAHISELRWNVGLQRVEINGNNWLLPKMGEYAVLYTDTNKREWNLMNFSDYHRYGAEVALRFDIAQ